MKTHMKDVSYIQLVAAVAKKIGLDESTTKLKLSYLPFLVDYYTPIYIVEDDDVLGFLMNYKDGCKGILHVEVVQNDLDDSVRGEDDTVDTVDLNQGEPSGFVENLNETFGNEEVHNDVEENGLISTEENGLISMGENGLVPIEENNILECCVFPVDGATENGPSQGAEWDDGLAELELHQEFEHKNSVFDMIQAAAHKNCFEFRVIKSDTKRLVVKCREAENGCKWGVRAAVLKNASLFSLRKHYRKHSCSRASTSTSCRRRKGTARLIAKMLTRDYAGRFDTPKPRILIDMFQKELGCRVSYWTAWRGRRRAAYAIRGTPEESYRTIHSYMYTLEQMNPGTVWAVGLDAEHRFLYLFFALGVCIEGFRFMRKVLIIDATHLKTAEAGVLAVVTAQDGNHHNYPIAFGILDGEKECSWTWFLSNLKRVIPDMCELVFVSDRNQGLINAIKVVYPFSKHGYCNYHMAQNTKVNGGGHKKNMKTLVKRFLECSNAYTEAEFLTLYDAFGKKYPAAGNYLENLHNDDKKCCKKDKWARCYFPGERYNIGSSNSVESVNGVLVAARKLSVQPMIDAIIKKLIEWFCTRRGTSSESVGAQKLVPFVESVMHDRCAEAQTLTVSDVNLYYLRFSVSGRDGHTNQVDLQKLTCSCKHFDIDKYPCVHGIAAAIKAKINLDTLCSPYFLCEYWASAYIPTIYPVPHVSEWVIPDHIKEMYALPPNYPRGKKKGRKGRMQERRASSTGEFYRRRKRIRTWRGRGMGRWRGRGMGRWFEPVVSDVPEG